MENETLKQEKWYQSMTVKMVLLAIMGLMLLIPLVLIMRGDQGAFAECRDGSDGDRRPVGLGADGHRSGTECARHKGHR